MSSSSSTTFECVIKKQCSGTFPCQHDVTFNGVSKLLSAVEIGTLIHENTNKSNYDGIAIENIFPVSNKITRKALASLQTKMCALFEENKVNSKQTDVYVEEYTDPRYPMCLEGFSGKINMTRDAIETGFQNATLQELFEDTFDYFVRHEHCRQMCLLPFALENSNTRKEGLAFTLFKLDKQEDEVQNVDESENAMDCQKEEIVPTCWIAHSLQDNNNDDNDNDAEDAQSDSAFLSILYNPNN
jgi:hypothetical protein